MVGHQLQAYGLPMLSLTRLRRIRQRKLLTQIELAKLADVSPATVATLERGKADARFETIKKLAGALEVDPMELIDERDRP
jgi:transcriptional regulator with XRE-family HTH domain